MRYGSHYSNENSAWWSESYIVWRSYKQKLMACKIIYHIINYKLNWISFAIIGTAKEGGGYVRYLRTRWDSGLPENRFCYPPTTNSEYAWKLQETVLQTQTDRRPRLNSIGPAFYRSRGVLCHADYAPYHFPRIYWMQKAIQSVCATYHCN